MTLSTPTPQAHELDHRIVAKYEAETSTAMIGDIFNPSRQSIIKILHEASFTTSLPRMGEAEIQEMTRLYASGLSLENISKQLGRNHSTIYKALKRTGIRMRDTHGRQA